MSSDWAPPLSLSSDDVPSFRFRIWWSSLSKPLSTTVLVKPLSQRHLGNFCCTPCIPLYHSLPHFWQPIKLLDSLHAIRGFLSGILLQIIHEKASSNSSKKRHTKLVSEPQIVERFYLALYFLDIFRKLFQLRLDSCAVCGEEDCPPYFYLFIYLFINLFIYLNLYLPLV